MVRSAIHRRAAGSLGLDNNCRVPTDQYESPVERTATSDEGGGNGGERLVSPIVG